MAQLSRETVEQVLAATDIVDLVGSYLPVKRAGTRFVALCPFHNEKSPSFSIDPARQFFHCFGCKKSGDAITFVRDYENLTFVDSVKKLAGRVGITVTEEALDPREEADRKRRGRLLDLHREVSRFFHSLLLRSPDAEHAREYLKSRGFGKEMAQRWEVGWAPASAKTFLDWAREKGLRGRDLVDSGLALQRDGGRGLYLRFRDRLMFPIRNDYGDVIAFSGRQLREDPRSGKYINSPETALFKKSRVLFALDRARKAVLREKSVLICEGQIDAIACHEQGIEHAIAPLGTAFTPEHARTLKRYARSALICFDADGAGFAAAERSFRELVGEGIAVRAVRMPAGEDPDSFMNRHGADAFRALLDESPNFFDFLIDQAKQDRQLDDPEQKSALARSCASLLAVMPDPVTRDPMISHVAARLQIGAPELRDAVVRAGRAEHRRAGRRHERRRSDDSEERPASPEPAALEPTIGYLCSLALRSAAARQWLAEQLETLAEISPHIDGVPILHDLLAADPDPDSPAALNAWLAELAEPRRLALQQDASFNLDLPETPLTAAAEALAAVSALALEKQDAAIKAELAEPGIGIERQVELLGRAKEIADLLGSLTNRALTLDRFAPNPQRTRAPNRFDGRNFPKQRKS